MPKQGKNIYLRKDGRWEGRFIKDRIAGKTHYGYVFGKTYEEAERKLNGVSSENILWNGIQAEAVQKAFWSLGYRDRTLLEKRNAICMTCGRVSSSNTKMTFEELATMFEGSGAGGAEKAYRRAVEKLTQKLVEAGVLHAVELRKKKNAAAIYEYRVDYDGEWGEIQFDFENGTAEIVRLADWDAVKTNKFANMVIAFLLEHDSDNLPQEAAIAIEP